MSKTEKLLSAALAYCEARDAEALAIKARLEAGCPESDLYDPYEKRAFRQRVCSCLKQVDGRPCWKQWEEHWYASDDCRRELPDRPEWCAPCLERDRLHRLIAPLRARRVANQAAMLRIWRAMRQNQ